MRPLILSIAIAIAGLIAAWELHRHAQLKFDQNDLRLRQQDEQLARLTAEQHALSNQLAEVAKTTNDPAHELARLSGQVEKLRSQTNNLIAQISSNRLARASHKKAQVTHPEEYWGQLHQAAGAKPHDALQLGQGVIEYALDHHGTFPSDLGQIDSYLKKEKMSLSGTNQFDIVFHGSLDDLKGLPAGGVAVLRDRQTWTAPDGQQARVYGMANGVAQTVLSNDDFKSWEAEHMFPSTSPAGP
jgi:DNA repair exonuclease SbcCD ATPase subunit